MVSPSARDSQGHTRVCVRKTTDKYAAILQGVTVGVFVYSRYVEDAVPYSGVMRGIVKGTGG